MNEETEEHENTPEQLRELKPVTAEETKEGQGDEDENASDSSDQDETFELMDESGAQESGKNRKKSGKKRKKRRKKNIKGKKKNVLSKRNTKETTGVEKTNERKKMKRKITDENRMKEKSKKSKKAKLVKSGTDEDKIIGSDVSDLEKFIVDTTAILEGAKLPLHKWESNVESSQEEEQILTPNTMLWGQNSYALGELSEERDESLYKRLTMARQHAWSRWQREYIHGLMEYHRVNKSPSAVPEIGEIVLIVGDEKNRGRWMKGKVVKYVKGKDGVIRGVIVLHKGNYLERPVQLVCPLEIRSVVKEDQGRHNESTEDNDDKLKERPERKAAKIAKVNIREQLKDD
ncbi:Hypothetical predicted protein [Paramuricea clavata]|nr:Hypothetical predicted protein [Paramuricea clavata]